MAKQHFLSLDSLRGILACSVAMAHFNANSIFVGSTIISRGDIYVDFFFVLSGFVIFDNYRDRLRSGFGVGKFVFLRFGRLYPLHFAVLMAFILTDLVQLAVTIPGAAAFKPFAAPGEGLYEITTNLLLIHALHVQHTYAFNGPSWSISVEFFTYIIFALILAWSGKHYRIFIVALATVSVVSLFYLNEDLYAKLDYGLLRCIFGFACGAMTYEAYQAYGPRLAQFAANRRLMNGVESVLAVLALVYVGCFSFGAWSFPAPVIFGVLIFVFAFESGIVTQGLKWRPLVFLGMLSYSIYMIHIYISGKFFFFPVRMLENRGWHLSVQRDHLQYLGTNLVWGTLLDVVYLIVVIACSYVSYRLIEKPGRDLARHLIARRSRADAGP